MLTAQTVSPQKKRHFKKSLQVFHHPPAPALAWLNFFSAAISHSLLATNYSGPRPREGSWLTHWVPSKGFDLLLWLWPSVSIGVVMRGREKERGSKRKKKFFPLVLAPIPGLSHCPGVRVGTAVIWCRPLVYLTSSLRLLPPLA